MLRFSLQRQMAPQQTAKFQTARFRQFHSILIKGSIAFMDRFGLGFRHLLED